MLDFMDYIQLAFAEGTNWNRDNSYSSLTATAQCMLLSLESWSRRDNGGKWLMKCDFEQPCSISLRLNDYASICRPCQPPISQRATP